ncbi:MAG: histidine phosphatase family protein, partial [Caulobacteraceae bacterium]|nr:histidine phosphatase family protein [Caulobacter sp.]
DALEADPRWHAWNRERDRHGIPGGETARDVQIRAMALIEHIAQEGGGACVLVSHSDVIKVVVLSLIGAPLGRYSHLAVDPASITTLDLWPGGGKVVRLNQEACA